MSEQSEDKQKSFDSYMERKNEYNHNRPYREYFFDYQSQLDHENYGGRVGFGTLFREASRIVHVARLSKEAYDLGILQMVIDYLMTNDQKLIAYHLHDYSPEEYRNSDYRQSIGMRLYDEDMNGRKKSLPKK